MKARFCVSYDRLGLVAVTDDRQGSVASTCKGLFLPHTMYVHRGSAVALLHVIFTLGPGRWKNCVWNIASLMAEGGKKTVKNVLAIKSSGKGHMSVPSAYGQLKQVTWPLLSLIGWAYKNLFMGGNPDSSVNCVNIHHVNLIKFILWAITILSAKYKVRFQVLCIN